MLIYILVHLVQKQKVWPLRSFPNIVVKRTLDLELKNVSPTLDILLTSYGTSLNLSVLIIKMGKIISTTKHCYENQMQLS